VTPLAEPSIEKLCATIQAAKRREADQDEALLVRRCRENFLQSDHQNRCVQDNAGRKPRRMPPCTCDARHYRPVTLVAQPLSGGRLSGTGFAHYRSAGLELTSWLAVTSALHLQAASSISEAASLISMARRIFKNVRRSST
jgi:hypothetical protein